MLRFAGPALLALAFAIILELGVADAAAVSGDLLFPEFCAGCAPLLDDSLKTEINSPIVIDDKTQSLSACKYNELYCRNSEQIFTIETTTEILELTNDHLGSEILVLATPIGYQGEYQGNSGCSYFESKLRDQSRVRAECNNIESGSNHGELVGVVTLTIVSAVAFAILAGVWLLHRLFSKWRLQRFFSHDERASDLQIHNGRRHPTSR
jgi:hypothetical protein